MMQLGGSLWEEDGVGRQPQHLMRALFAIGSLDSGGSETQLTEVLLRIREYGIDPALVLMEAPHDRRRIVRLEAAGIRPLVIGGLTGHRLRDPVRLVRGYARALREVRPEVVYPWLEETALILVPLAHIRRIPSVVARRNIGGSAYERSRHWAFAIRQAEAAATLVTGNSEAVLRVAADRGVARERLRLVRNGHPPVKALPEPEGPEITFGCLARFRPEKGHLRLLDTAALLPREPPWRLLLGGTGPLEADVRARASSLGIEDRVGFVGEVADVRGFWGEAHVGVLLSDHEGSPNALIEAALAGRPSVATAVGGIVELISPDIGFTVAPNDLEAGAHAMKALIDDATLRKTMGAAAHDRVSVEFDMDASIRAHAAVMFEAVAQYHRTGGPSGKRISPASSATGHRAEG
jgi:glycosyltransferase involved in cell wall biosynthesis